MSDVIQAEQGEGRLGVGWGGDGSVDAGIFTVVEGGLRQS